ncbi:hypothetical protein [Paenibacillus sp. J2TS4]|uniref:IS66 family insertion sequence element accessory protein TnpA n=1 Tax=Paenibacillus sp. J2TS4 TaxID=2807194 RepID=UPI001B13A2DF|nr:hypothetical protein [Paenibacillus sp. J2TS4]GIP33493.1 hypothetical protein J2TS4_27030 [Paenibacillus sp. J2TS4]
MERIATYRASGKTMKAWCAEQGLSVDQLKYWLYKAKKKEDLSPAAPPAFRPVNVISQEGTEKASSHSLWVQVGSARIAVTPSFEPQLLRDVVRTLETLC